MTIRPAAAPQSFRYPLVSGSPTEAKARCSKPLCKSLCKPSVFFPLPRGRFSQRFFCHRADCTSGERVRFRSSVIPNAPKRKGSGRETNKRKQCFPFRFQANARKNNASAPNRLLPILLIAFLPRGGESVPPIHSPVHFPSLFPFNPFSEPFGGIIRPATGIFPELLFTP